jgi:hypothetical protein
VEGLRGGEAVKAVGCTDGVGYYNKVPGALVKASGILVPYVGTWIGRAPGIYLDKRLEYKGGGVG